MNSGNGDGDTIAATAVPQGSSALSVLRLSGPGVRGIVREAFGKKDFEERRADFGVYRCCDGKAADTCVRVFYAGPRSYTGEDMLEIFCHGNPFIVRRIKEDLLRRGCRDAGPGEFTKRAFLNGKMNLTQAEAVAGVIAAQSEKAFEASMRLLEGELGKRISDWENEILGIIADVELHIDFTEEDVPLADMDSVCGRIEDVKRALTECAAGAKYEAKIHNGINVVAAGAPNAGKSSLLNVLTGSDRAIVSEEAGTTRDFICERISLGGYSVNIIDTAGIRVNPQSATESEGIRRTCEWLKKADLVLWLADLSVCAEPIPDAVKEILCGKKVLFVKNKSDLSPCPALFEFPVECAEVTVSMKSADAGEILENAVLGIIKSENIVPDEDVLVVSSRHAALMEEAVSILDEACRIAKSMPVEFVSAKLREALIVLSEILGKFDNEKVLERIFSKFCIGK